MMELEELFERQAEWQREQANLPWSEKLRQSAIMREALLALKWPLHYHNPSRDSDEQPYHTNR
jgi:hypothetical protein